MNPEVIKKAKLEILALCAGLVMIVPLVCVGIGLATGWSAGTCALFYWPLLFGYIACVGKLLKKP
tara:strand:+ start:778 stop:972 length:195 start_codon:yes stop_codon:yes gene_type:complete